MAFSPASTLFQRLLVCRMTVVFISRSLLAVATHRRVIATMIESGGPVQVGVRRELLREGHVVSRVMAMSIERDVAIGKRGLRASLRQSCLRREESGINRKTLLKVRGACL